MSKEILQPSDYNLRFICPNILIYKNRYPDYIREVYNFNTDLQAINKYLLIEDLPLRISSFSSYLVFNILNNFFINRSVIKKDVEGYYNSEMLNFLKKSRTIGSFQLKSLALTWNSISKSIDFFLKTIEDHESVISQYPAYWSDGEFNYKEDIPLIGLNKDQSLDLYLILQTDLIKYPLYSTSIDYLRIPSVIRILDYFLSQNVNLNSLRILWLDNTDMNSKFKFSIYKDFNNDKPKRFIKAHSNLKFFKEDSAIKYPNLNVCYSCPYFTACSSSDLLLINNRKVSLPQLQTNFSTRII